MSVDERVVSHEVWSSEKTSLKMSMLIPPATAVSPQKEIPSPFVVPRHCGNGSPSPIRRIRRLDVSIPHAETREAPPHGASRSTSLTNVHCCLQLSLAPLFFLQNVDREGNSRVFNDFVSPVCASFFFPVISSSPRRSRSRAKKNSAVLKNWRRHD